MNILSISTFNQTHFNHNTIRMIISNKYPLYNSILLFSLTFLLLCSPVVSSHAQDSTKVWNHTKADSSKQALNMDAVYNRPFLTTNKLPVAVGGYIEANTQYETIDGANDGLHFQMRRMTLFFSSTIAKKIKFISELEFENGTQEIGMETALMDIEFHPLLNFRSGVLLNPIGAFNQNHDGPKWDFVDRPLASTEIIPTTLSNVGFGFHGKYFHRRSIIGYEAYLTNGLNEKLILNESDHTSFHEAKEGADRFVRNEGQQPMLTAKIALRNRKWGELGLSFLSGVYNHWKNEGVVVDQKRLASIVALDVNTSLFKNRITVVGECIRSMVELPANYVQTYGTGQFGFYVDVIGNIWTGQVLGWEHAKLNMGLRTDYADYNTDRFRDTKNKIFDESWALTGSVAFRPSGTVVLRLNYKYMERKDFVGNPPEKTGSIQFGVSSYF